jgi:hypothetical protein
LGVWLLMPESRRTRLDLVLAGGAGALVVAAVACVLWLGTDVVIGGVWFAVALVGLGLAVWRIRATTA